MDNLWDVVGAVINQSINGSGDYNELFEDPDAYFGVELLDPENLWNAAATGELPPFQENIAEFINNPSIATAIGIIPGFGESYQTGVQAAGVLFDLPQWIDGNVDTPPSVFDNAFDNENPEEEIIFESPTVTPETTPETPSHVRHCRCCCC